MSRGFSLLEVLVALVILSLAIVTLLQLSSRGLGLLRLADDYQQAVRLAESLAGATDFLGEGEVAGRVGAYRWERRISVVSVPDDLAPPSGPLPRLYAVSIAVHWGRGHALDLADLRTVVPDEIAASGPVR